MSVAKNIEISSRSSVSFEDAIDRGIARASETIKNLRSAWIKEQKISISSGDVREYEVMMILTFVLDGGGDDGRSSGSSKKASKKSSSKGR